MLPGTGDATIRAWTSCSSRTRTRSRSLSQRVSAAKDSRVERVATGAGALAAEPADLVLLDLRLPDIDGTEVCRVLRSRSDVPIIVVTAKGEEVDRVVGLELGADDYVVKPFGFRELLARIRAVLRRTRPESSGSRLVAGGLVVDLPSRRATLTGEDLALTPKEFDLLALLASEPGTVVSREHLLREVWKTDSNT